MLGMDHRLEGSQVKVRRTRRLKEVCETMVRSRIPFIIAQSGASAAHCMGEVHQKPFHLCGK